MLFAGFHKAPVTAYRDAVHSLSCHVCVSCRAAVAVPKGRTSANFPSGPSEHFLVVGYDKHADKLLTSVDFFDLWPMPAIPSTASKLADASSLDNSQALDTRHYRHLHTASEMIHIQEKITLSDTSPIAYSSSFESVPQVDSPSRTHDVDPLGAASPGSPAWHPGAAPLAPLSWPSHRASHVSAPHS